MGDHGQGSSLVSGMHGTPRSIPGLLYPKEKDPPRGDVSHCADGSSGASGSSYGGGENSGRRLVTRLDKVALCSWTEAGEECSSTLIGNDLAEAANESLVVRHGVELDAGLDDIDRSERAVGDGAADTSRERALQVILDAKGALPHDLAIAGRGRGRNRAFEAAEKAEAGRRGDTRETE